MKERTVMIRPITPHDIETVLAINNNAVPAVNSLTANELTDIINISEKKVLPATVLIIAMAYGVIAATFYFH